MTLMHLLGGGAWSNIKKIGIIFFFPFLTWLAFHFVKVCRKRANSSRKKKRVFFVKLWSTLLIFQQFYYWWSHTWIWTMFPYPTYDWGAILQSIYRTISSEWAQCLIRHKEAQHFWFYTCDDNILAMHYKLLYTTQDWFHVEGFFYLACWWGGQGNVTRWTAQTLQTNTHKECGVYYRRHVMLHTILGSFASTAVTHKSYGPPPMNVRINIFKINEK